MKWLEASKGTRKPELRSGSLTFLQAKKAAKEKGAPPVEEISGSMTFLEAQAWGEAKDLAKMDRRGYEDKALHPTGEMENKALEWPLKMPPQTYLILHPEGQWAELAHAILEAEAEPDAEPTEAETD